MTRRPTARWTDPLILVWRWRCELALLVVAGSAWYALTLVLEGPVAAVVLIDIATLLLALPVPRRWLVAHAYCTLTRHRLYRVFRESRLTTRGGLLPFILRVSPTAEGERVTLWCRAGMYASQVERRVEQFRAGCWVQDVDVEPDPKHPQIVVLRLIRRRTALERLRTQLRLALPVLSWRRRDRAAVLRRLRHRAG